MLQAVKLPASVRSALLAAVGGEAARCVDDERVLAEYGVDFTAVVDKGAPQVLVRVKSVAEVQAVLAVANAHRVPVTTRSAGFGLGSSLAREGGILLDMALMDRILEVSEDGLYALIEPGVTFEMLTPELVKRGLVVSIPDAPPRVSVLGNHLSFGIGAYLQQYGIGPELVLGLEAVLPSGEVIRTGSAAQEGAGWFARFVFNPIPDVAGLFLGSMGTIGVVTKLAVRVFPVPPAVEYTKLGFDDIGKAASAIELLCRRGLCDRVSGFSWFFAPEVTQRYADRITGAPLSLDELREMRKSLAQPETYFFVGVHGEPEVVAARTRALVRIATAEYGGRVMPQTADDLEKYRNPAIGLPQTQSERAILGRKGRFLGAYDTVFTYTPIKNWPKIYAEWDRIAAEHGHPLAMNTKLFGQGRFSSFRFIISYFDQHDRADRERITRMCQALSAAARRNGAVTSYLTPAELKELASYPLYAQVKRALDPNGIMHPAMGDWRG